MFEMYASAIKNLMSGTYVTIEKANLQALRLHYTNLTITSMLLSLSSLGILSHTLYGGDGS